MALLPASLAQGRGTEHADHHGAQGREDHHGGNQGHQHGPSLPLQAVCPARRSPPKGLEGQAGKPPGQKKDHGDQDRAGHGQEGKSCQRRHQQPDEETGERLVFNGRRKRRAHLVVVTDEGLPRVCRKQDAVPELSQHLDNGMVRIAIGGCRHEALLAAVLRRRVRGRGKRSAAGVVVVPGRDGSDRRKRSLPCRGGPARSEHSPRKDSGCPVPCSRGSRRWTGCT